MSKKMKVAAVLTVTGLILFAAVMTVYGWDFTKLSTVPYETDTYEIGEDFDEISVDTGTADIYLAFSGDGGCKVVCEEPENAKHTAEVSNGELSVRAADDRKWYEHIGIYPKSPKVTVYLPKTEYASLRISESTGDIEIPAEFAFQNADISLSTGDVRFAASVSERLAIQTSTGDIRVENVSADALDLNVSTGTAVVADSACDSICSSGSTGDITLKNVTVSGKISIERSTGDVRLDGADAAEIFVKTSTGDVSGSLLSEKVFAVETSTGSIRVPETTGGGKCEIITSTGDIKLDIAGTGAERLD